MQKNERQLKLKGMSGWGGKRRGSGRKKVLEGMLNHTIRPSITRLTACHINLHLSKELQSLNLRTMDLFKLFRIAVKRARIKGLSIIHYAIMDNHIHLIVEARSNEEISKGMQSFALSMNKLVKFRLLKKLKKLWKDRYFMRKLTSPRELKVALGYVFKNPQKKWKRASHFDLYTSVLAIDSYSQTVSKFLLHRFDEVKREILIPPEGFLIRDVQDQFVIA